MKIVLGSFSARNYRTRAALCFSNTVELHKRRLEEFLHLRDLGNKQAAAVHPHTRGHRSRRCKHCCRGPLLRGGKLFGFTVISDILDVCHHELFDESF